MLLRDDVHNALHERCVKNVIDIIVLAILRDGNVKLGAYDLIAAIQDRFKVMVSPGVIYPKLFSLQREGLIKVEWRAKKKVYSLTDKGREMSEVFLESFIYVNTRLFSFMKPKAEE
jgi:DNA-binding PadR family transcriptional regulator